jgi:hypothetical protein
LRPHRPIDYVRPWPPWTTIPDERQALQRRISELRQLIALRLERLRATRSL